MVYKLKGIPIVKSGEKYRTQSGFSAVKNGVNQHRGWADVPAGLSVEIAIDDSRRAADVRFAGGRQAIGAR